MVMMLRRVSEKHSHKAWMLFEGNLDSIQVMIKKVERSAEATASTRRRQSGKGSSVLQGRRRKGRDFKVGQGMDVEHGSSEVEMSPLQCFLHMHEGFTLRLGFDVERGNSQIECAADIAHCSELGNGEFAGSLRPWFA